MPTMTNYKPEDITPSMRKYLGISSGTMDSGTHEGAVKAAQTRKSKGVGSVNVVINSVPRKYSVPESRISPSDTSAIKGLHEKGYETYEHPDHGVIFRKSGLVGHTDSNMAFTPYMKKNV